MFTGDANNRPREERDHDGPDGGRKIRGHTFDADLRENRRQRGRDRRDTRKEEPRHRDLLYHDLPSRWRVVTSGRRADRSGPSLQHASIGIVFADQRSGRSPCCVLKRSWRSTRRVERSMSIHYSVEPISGRITTRADGILTFHEINAHLDLEERNQDLHRPELIDA